jgi:hypothetical protein
MIFDASRSVPHSGKGWLIGPEEELVVYTTMCDNPACDCNEVTAVAAALDDDGSIGPALATLLVGAEGAIDATGRPDLIEELRKLPRSVTDDDLTFGLASL